jgi:hypothetical protein
MEIGDASWERPAGGVGALLTSRTLGRGFWCLLVVTQLAWIAGLVALGLWLS